MDHSPETRPSLLLRIRDFRDDDAWNQFIELYAPLIYAYLRKRNIQDADAGDLTQDVLSSVTSAANEFTYDPKARFIQRLVADCDTKQDAEFPVSRKETPGRVVETAGVQRAIEEKTAEEDDRTQWDLEYERRLFEWAAEKCRSEFQDTTWQAFWMTAVENQTAASVASTAETLNVTVGAVYVAKSRVTARLRQDHRSTLSMKAFLVNPSPRHTLIKHRNFWACTDRTA